MKLILNSIIIEISVTVVVVVVARRCQSMVFDRLIAINTINNNQ